MTSPKISPEEILQAIALAIPRETIEGAIKMGGRSLMFQAVGQQGLSPLRLGFTGTLRVVRRAMAQFQQSPPEEIPLFLASSKAEKRTFAIYSAA